MFSNLKTAFQNITSKDKNEDEYDGEDIQAVLRFENIFDLLNFKFK